ncbi:barstar family protein [Streptomyces gibsoniae]|uniref:Barstar family protein n=1 Tax=Streptomyces gibsoniae TaxID=3075529 RepID=A0ABU2U5P3_9ACTN|nr:barstar family protein [Streptomyces sp. DSM 41699]MDT0468539.1 barstar family protein [Streptomyces sp. DSM 41699]
MHEIRDHRGQARYTLTDGKHGHVWGVCAETDGLFGHPRRGTYELFGWVPEGAEAHGAWMGSRLWLVPEDQALEPWLLEDAESLERSPGADGLVLTALDDYEGPPEGYRGFVRVHDENRWLGSCQEFTRIVPSEQPAPRLVLRGLAPGEELRRALAKGTRRALDLEQVALEVRDDRGEPLTELLLGSTIRGWRPSAHGKDLIDLELDGEQFAPVPEYARSLWERWLAGPPGTLGAWSDLDARERDAWLDLVRERFCRRERHDRPAGHAYELDGRHITDVPGLYLALGEAVNGPGGYFGGCLAALDDCLRGTFGHTAPATLLWRNSANAREHLSRNLTPDGRHFDLFTETLDALADGGMHVTLA